MMIQRERQSSVYILDGVRTAMANPFQGFRNVTVAQMAAAIICELVSRNKIKKSLISEVILGNAVSAGTGQNFARQAVFLSGFPLSIPAYCVSNVCGSGLQAVVLAMQSALFHNTGIIVAGGAENVTRSPHMLSKDDEVALKDKTPIDSLIYDALWCLMTGKHMGELCEDMARQHKISRQEQDLYSLQSHQKACAAAEQGKFQKEIVPVDVAPNQIVAGDERPRRNVTIESFAGLPPGFTEKGTVTAGNSASPCDGASAVLVASEETVKKEKLRPLAKIVATATVAGKPEDSFTVCIPAIKKCLKNCQWTVKDVDLFEISEAFAAQIILVQKKLQIPEDKLNIWGGDIALGHALGAAGTRILTTLMHALIDQGKKKGIAGICFGGGGAIAVAIEMV